MKHSRLSLRFLSNGLAHIKPMNNFGSATEEKTKLDQFGFRLLTTMLIWLVYILGFLVLVPVLKEPTGILVLLPIILGSWLWGMRKGAALAFFGACLNVLLYLPTGLLENRSWIIAVPGIVVFLVGVMVGYLQDLRQTLKRQNILISYHADHDSLTGLLNRNSFGREAKLRLERTNTADQTALLYIDLDGFKSVNDNFGHAVGDLLLVAVAERLRKLTRKADLHARIGGDEFALMLSQLSEAEDAERIATALLASLSEPFMLSKVTVSVQASIGVSMAPQDGMTLDELLKSSDQAMYSVKANGKNGIWFAAPQEKTMPDQNAAQGLNPTLAQ